MDVTEHRRSDGLCNPLLENNRICVTCDVGMKRWPYPIRSYSSVIVVSAFNIVYELQ